MADKKKISKQRKPGSELFDSYISLPEVIGFGEINNSDMKIIRFGYKKNSSQYTIANSFILTRENQIDIIKALSKNLKLEEDNYNGD